jgi:PilZ domain
MPIPARLQTTQARADRRSSPRHQLCLGSDIRGEAVTIHDLSATGMLIETAADLHPFDALEIELPEAGRTMALVVWHSGRYFGCEFKEPIFQAAVSAARLRSPSAVAVEVVQSILPLEQPNFAADESPPDNALEDDRAPVAVRLRVIFGSAFVLWALIIWAVAHLVGWARGALG